MIKSIVAMFAAPTKTLTFMGVVRASERRTRTVEGALTHFNRAVEELKQVEQQERAEAARQDAIITAGLTAKAAAEVQAARAGEIASRINAIIN